MALALAESFVVARRTLEEASDALGESLFERLADDVALRATELAQPAILAASIAAYRVAASEVGGLPVLAAGHSLGEYSALVAAGALPFAPTVKLARLRGQLMQQAAPRGTGLMAAIFGVTGKIVEAACLAESKGAERVSVANFNSADQSVVSGHVEAVRRVCRALDAQGGSAHELNVSIAAHSALMEPIVEGFREALDAIELGAFAFPVLSNATTQPFSTERLREELARQLVSPVRWAEIMESMRKSGIDFVIEFGPKTVLRDLWKLEFPRSVALSVGQPADVERLKSLVGATPLEGLALEDVQRFVGHCLRIAASTRNHNPSSAAHEAGVALPYDRLEALRRTGGNPREIVLEAAELLRRILKTKKVPAADVTAHLQTMQASIPWTDQLVFR